MWGGKHEDSPHLMRYSKNVYFIIISSTADRLIRTGGQKMTLEEERGIACRGYADKDSGKEDRI